MTCCLIAALIVAHIMAVLRRWGVFLGLIAPGEYDDPDTMVRRVREWVGRPRVRVVVRALVVTEVMALGLWVWSAHGTHLYRLGDEAFGRMRGEMIVYSPICSPGSKDRAVRLVLAPRNGLDRAARIGGAS